MKKEFKVLEFMYESAQIHFLIYPESDHVMVNATEMAKLFEKRTDHYLANKETIDFIEFLKVPEMSGTLIPKITDNRGRNGIYFCELLAIDFATWLDVKFKIWVYKKIQEITFGNYKKHWDAHLIQEQAKKDMDFYKQKILLEAKQEDVISYFEAEKTYKSAKATKLQAIQNQYKMAL